MGSLSSPPPNPPLTISHATDADIPDLVTLHNKAFLNSSPTRQQMYAAIPPAALHDYQCAKFRKVIKQQSLNPSSPSGAEGKPIREVHFLKVTQPAANNEEVILALAIWSILPDGYDEAADVAGLNEGIPEGADERLWRDFAAKAGRLRAAETGGGRRRVGQAHWLLDLLATHPSHERKGAASKLVRWPFERVDRDGMRCFVEASKAGQPMYERCGFENSGAEMTVDLREYVEGWEGPVQRWVGMVREPAGGAVVQAPE